MPRDTGSCHEAYVPSCRLPLLDISAAIDALKADLRGLGASTVSCPWQAPNCGLV